MTPVARSSTPGFMDTHAHTDPHVFWNPSLDPEPFHGVTTMLVGQLRAHAVPGERRRPARRSATSSPTSRTSPATSSTTACHGPGTTSPGTGSRRPGRDRGQHRRAGRSQPAPHRGRWATMPGHGWRRPPSAPRWQRCSTQAMQAGAWGLSVSFYDVDKAGRPIPSRWADGAEFDALIDVIAASRPWPGRAPARADPSRAREVVRRSGPPVWSAGRVADVDRLRSHGPDPAVTEGWLDFTRRLAADDIRALPATLAPNRGLQGELVVVDDVHVDDAGLAPTHQRACRGQGRTSFEIPSGEPSPARNGTGSTASCSPTGTPRW